MQTCKMCLIGFATLAAVLLGATGSSLVSASLMEPVLVEARPNPPVVGYPVRIFMHHPLVGIGAARLQWRHAGEAHWHSLPGCELALPAVSESTLHLQFRVVDSSGRASAVVDWIRTPIPPWPKVVLVGTEPAGGPVYGEPFRIHLLAQSPLLRRARIEWRQPGQANWQRSDQPTLLLPRVQTLRLHIEARAVDEQGLTSPPVMYSWEVNPLIRSYPVAQLAGKRGHFALHTLALVPDGQRVVFGGDYGLLGVLHLATGEVQLLTGHDATKPIWDVAVVRSTRGEWLAISASGDGTARIWDLDKALPRAILSGHQGSVNAVAFSPDGSLAFTAGEDGKWIMWETASGKLSREKALDENPVICSLRTWFDGKDVLLAIGDAMKQLHIWNASQGNLILSQPADSRMIWALASYPEVRLLTAGAQPSVRYWRYKDSKLEHVFDLKQPIPTVAAQPWFREPTFTAADFTPDGRYAVACDREGGLHLWSLETGRRLRTLRQPGEQLNDLTRGFSDVQVTPDGQFAFTADRHGYIRFWFIGERP